MHPDETSTCNQAMEDSHKLKVQQLFMAHQNAILAYLLSLVPNYQDAQDLLQEVFLVVTRKADTWVEGTNFWAWVCAIARYEALHHVRSDKRRFIPLDLDVLDLVYGETPNLDILESKIDRLRKCIKQLSPRARELIQLRYHASQMPEAIAETLQWSVNSVRVALTRAKDNLRKCMSEGPAKEECA